MKKILVPTDFSFCAEEAGKAALQLGKITNAEIDYLHLMDVPHDWIKLLERDQDQMYPDITQKVKKSNFKLDEYVKLTEKEGLTSKKILAYNENYKYIVKLAEDGGYDYIVMGSNGASGIRELILGSNTQRVIKASTVPVLVVKDFPVHFESSRIVFMSDFDMESMPGYEKLLEVSKAINSKIHLLYVNVPNAFEPTDVIHDRMKPYIELAEGQLDGYTIYCSIEYEDGLKKFVKTNTDILGMVTHRSNTRLAQQVVNHMSIPTLNIHVAD